MLNKHDSDVIRTMVIAMTIVICTYFATNAEISVELDHMVTPVDLNDADTTTEPAYSYRDTEDEAREI